MSEAAIPSLPVDEPVEAIIQVAMPEEAQPFLDAATEAGPQLAVAGARRRHLTLAGRRVVLVISGVGIVNGAHAATRAIARYGEQVPLISAGTAGGLDAAAQLGEVIVSDALVNIEADARAFGYARGQVPGMPATYQADAELRRALLTGSTALPGVSVREGGIGSGEKFVTAAIAGILREDFPDLAAVDMESAALAQIATKHGTPFVSVRAISDLCAPDGEEFLANVDDAAARSAQVVIAGLAAI